MIECSLCQQQFNDKVDPLIDHVKEIHERWHTNCRKEKRNTTEGKVVWRKL